MPFRYLHASFGLPFIAYSKALRYQLRLSCWFHTWVTELTLAEQYATLHDPSSEIVTPKGVLPPALCHVSATHESA